MPILNCYVDLETMVRLERIAADLGRSPVDLAECAIAEAALAAARDAGFVHPNQEARRG